tara:strand:- start:80 stop:808 length:729 start_codon:yes stop_codon:yes gene_type:complete
MLQFRADPALGILYLVFGIRESGSPAMHRGTALDHTIGKLLIDIDNYSHEDARQIALLHYDHLISSNAEDYLTKDIDRERHVVSDCLDHCYPVISGWSRPLSYQHPIKLKLKGIEVPIIGFIDLTYKNKVRELKTSIRRKMSITDDHAFQVATYAMAVRQESGDWPSAFVDYLTPSGMVSFRLTQGKHWVAEVVSTAGKIRDLLSKAKNKEELCASVKPNFTNSLWRYRPNSLKAAKEYFIS